MTVVLIIIAAAAVALLIVAIVAVHRDKARMFSGRGAGELARECSVCRRPLRAGASTCPHCGTDTVVLIV